MLIRLVVASLLIAPAAIAQISEKDARDLLKDATSDALDVFKDAVKDATEAGSDGIKAFGKNVKSDGYQEEDLDELFAELAAAHQAIRLAYDDAENTIAEEGMLALSAYLEDQDGGFEPLHPEVFVEKDRGVLGKARAEMAKRALKAAAKLRSGLKKVAKTLDSETDMALSYAVEPVEPLFEVVFGATQTLVSSSDEPVRIDLMLVVRPVEEEDTANGTSRFCGSFAGGEVVVTTQFNNGFTFTTAIDEDEENGRWTGGFLTGQGNTVVTAKHNDDVSGKGGVDTLTIGVR